MTIKTAYNSTFPIAGVSCCTDSFVVTGSVVLRINIYAEKSALLVAANHWLQFPKNVKRGDRILRIL
ncbi:MAG: hypothetical protein RO257_02815 [Candidatus Kapabacteria bacterium]|jgi:hypothetical protein|nr:hypothetical protein [Candidatus Kapabacteria bacterium]